MSGIVAPASDASADPSASSTAPASAPPVPQRSDAAATAASAAEPAASIGVDMGTPAKDDTAPDPAEPRARPRWLTLLMVGGSILLLLSLVGAIIGSFHEEILAGLAWCQREKPWSAVLYAVFIIVATVLALPVMVLEIGAGFIFGFGVSVLMLIPAKALGATACLVLGRYMFKDFAARLIAKSEDFQNLLLAVERFPWKITLLLRCAMLPGALKSYGMALTTMPVWIFFVCCLVGDLPYTLLWSYVGSRGQSLTEVLNGNVEKTPGQSALSLLGLLFLVFLVRAVKASVDQAVKETKESQQHHEEDNGGKGLEEESKSAEERLELVSSV